MECNKEEACRAKTLAEEMMEKGDFVGAKKLVMKAQRLFSGLHSLPQMLAVCDVHCSAEQKISGLENWYGILQAMHFSDDATIKKQYRKLALLLHPDKNQFAGAEAAFKLIGEANRLLTDKEKRTQYDIKRRIYARSASRHLNANSGLQCAPANNASDSTVNSVTFWACCKHCGERYKYLRQYVNTIMCCSKCKRSFMAFDTGYSGVRPNSSTGQKEVRNPDNTTVNKNVESNGAQPGSVAAEVDKKGSFKKNKKNGGGENEHAKVRKPNLEDELMKNCAESSKPENGERKMKNTDELHKQQPEVTEPETGASKSVPDESVSKSDQAPSTSKGKKRRRHIVEEPTEKTTEKQNLGVGSSQLFDSGDSPAPSCVCKGKAKTNVDSGFQETSSAKDKKSKGCDARGEGMDMAGKIDPNHKASEKPIKQESPDPDFNNFELTTSSFAVNQVWSLYDPTDGMPRLYARIKKVFDSEFKLGITWIDPLQDNKDNTIPICCGAFKDGDSQEVDDHLIFSSKMLHLHRDNNIVMYPRRGEIWAVFRGWDMNWSASSENHKWVYEYDFVEILSDFDDVDGLGVAYLGKVEGFVSVFRRQAQYGVLQLQVPPSEMLRFSHKVPSFKMTGKEREDVPPGCFELDTAALPKDFEVDNSKVDVGLDRERQNGKAGGPFPEASEVELQANTTLESTPSPKKRQKVHEKDEMSSVKKSRKSVKTVDDLKLRKSPRRLSETINQSTSRSGQRKAEKNSANNGESCGEPDGFCISGEKMTTPKKPEKTVATNSSGIRETPQDTHKPTGNSKKRGRNDESLSPSRGNGLLTQLNGSTRTSEPESHVPSSCRTRQENTFNFENQRSADKFLVDQVWAIYSDDKGMMPRKYGQIKRIDTSPEFKLHVAPLELYRPSNRMTTHSVCCGHFKLKTGIAEVLLPSSFSHEVKAMKIGAKKFEVYPGAGEIWALYKNWNCAETEEVEIVEVVETDEQSIRVVPLTAKGFNKLLYGRSQKSKAGFVVIAKTEVSRFSHQIPAYRQLKRVTRFGDGECWELDPKAVLDLKS